MAMEWVKAFWGLEPRWISEPDVAIIEKLARKHLQVSDSSDCTVSFFAEGGFNKVYKITTANETSVMRVSLPVCAKLKTESEVATLEFLRSRTTIPVPRIKAYDSTTNNELGLEWILMEMMPGSQLRKCWRKMSMESKERLARTIANYVTQLQQCQNRFKDIGNIYVPEASTTSETRMTNGTSEPFQLGQIVSLEFFWGGRTYKKDEGGPFTSTQVWMNARLDIVIAEQERIEMDSSIDEDDRECAQTSIEIAEALKETVAQVFRERDTVDDYTVLCHNDFSDTNVLVDEEGNITAIIDWERVAVVPSWKATQVPRIFYGQTRNKEPIREEYVDALSDKKAAGEYYKEDELGDEGKCRVYWEHVLEYEQTRIRPIFWNELGVTREEYEKHWEQNELAADLDYAINLCDNDLMHNRILDWVDGIRDDERYNLRETMRDVRRKFGYEENHTGQPSWQVR